MCHYIYEAFLAACSPHSVLLYAAQHFDSFRCYTNATIRFKNLFLLCPMKIIQTACFLQVKLHALLHKLKCVAAQNRMKLALLDQGFLKRLSPQTTCLVPPARLFASPSSSTSFSKHRSHDRSFSETLGFILFILPPVVILPSQFG